jgi:hypothetical protein
MLQSTPNKEKLSESNPATNELRFDRIELKISSNINTF